MKVLDAVSSCVKMANEKCQMMSNDKWKMIRSLPLAVLTRQSESQPRAALPALITKEAGQVPPLKFGAE